MKILLTRPDNTTPMLIPNIGLGYLATALLQKGHSVSLLDCIRDKVTAEKFSNYLASHSFDLIGFQIYTFDVHVLQPYIDAAKEILPEAFLISGGPHPTANPEEMLNLFPQLGAILSGEAETSLPMLCNLLEKGTDFAEKRLFKNLLTSHENISNKLENISNKLDELAEIKSIPGLVIRDGKNSFFKNPIEMIKNLDELGFPAWELLEPAKYPAAPQGTFTKRLPVAPIIVTRGCPFDCTFCAAHLVAGKRLRSRSPINVVDEIEYLMSSFGIREIHIEDDNFTLNKKMVQRFCNEILSRKIDIAWACPNGLRLDSLDEDIVKLMEKAGCYSFAVGIESGSQKTLDKMKKRLKKEIVAEKIAMIKNVSSIKITGFFMIGYPGETVSQILETIHFALKLPIDKVNFGAFMPLPGTEAYQNLKEINNLENLDYSKITEYRAPFSFGEVSPFKLKLLLQWAFFRFYIRPRILYNIMNEIQSWEQLRSLGKRFLEVFWR